VSFKDKCAIIGIGETPFSKNSGMTEMQLMTHVAKMAADDAGISVKDIDGFIVPGIVAPGPGALETNLGITPNYTSHVPLAGASSTASIMQAAAVVSAGIAKRVLCITCRNDYSSPTRRRQSRNVTRPSVRGNAAFEAPYGWVAEAPHYAMMARKHMLTYGTTSRQLGAVAVSTRANACLNEHAQMRTPITIEDHQNSRMIADPFRLLDCSVITDGGAGVIVASAEEARDRKQKPVYIMGGAQGIPTVPNEIPNRPDMMEFGARRAAEKAFAMAGIGPEDVDVAEIYDCFTYVVIKQLEDIGFCKPGEGGPFAESGAIKLDGSLPVNTHGGLLSQGHMSGMNHVVEATRQMRGEAGSSQIANAKVALVSGYGDYGDGSIAILHN
jgi:acetyl-CoA acetyltransferase